MHSQVKQQGELRHPDRAELFCVETIYHVLEHSDCTNFEKVGD